MHKLLLRKSWLLIVAIFILSLLIAACDNPFDPLSEEAEIKGLSYFDWAGSWDRWDSDPEYDGFVITMEYFNEYGDTLEFKGKDHIITIEFYTQKIVGGEVDDEGNVTGGHNTYDALMFSYSVNFENSDDEIRIAKELYEGALRSSGYDLEEETASVFVIVRVYPPEGKPQTELVLGYPEVEVYEPTLSEVTPNP